MPEEVLYRGRQDSSLICHVYAVRDGKEIQLDSEQKGVTWGYRGTGPRHLVELLVDDYYQNDPNGKEKSEKARELFQSLTDEIPQETSKWELTRRDIELALLDRPFKPTREELVNELLGFNEDELLHLIRKMKRTKRRWLLAGASMSAAG